MNKGFRANDWMWGRMDAGAGLIDVIVRKEHVGHRDVPSTGGRADVLADSARDAFLTPFDDTPEGQSATLLCQSLWDPDRHER